VQAQHDRVAFKSSAGDPIYADFTVTEAIFQKCRRKCRAAFKSLVREPSDPEKAREPEKIRFWTTRQNGNGTVQYALRRCQSRIHQFWPDRSSM